MHTILLIEDQIDIAHNIAEFLQMHAYTVDTLPQAHIHSQSFMGSLQQYNLILLDIGLPDWDGFEVCAAIRSQYTIPIIFITAREHIDDRVLGFSLGAHDYLVKPFDLRELLARIRVHIPLQKHTPRYFCNDLQIDFETYCFTKQGIPLLLTQREQEILRILIEKPGSVVSRTELIESLWGEASFFAGDNRLDVHISLLRKKIGNDFIVTVKGIGYKIKVA